jgi:hypothetical protein
LRIGQDVSCARWMSLLDAIAHTFVHSKHYTGRPFMVLTFVFWFLSFVRDGRRCAIVGDVGDVGVGGVQ